MEQYDLIPVGRNERPLSIEAWCEWFASIYSSANHRAPWQVYASRMTAHAFGICDPKNHPSVNPDGFDQECRWFFAWMCGLLNHLQITRISRMVLLEFPYVCPRCFRGSCHADTLCAGKKRDRVKAHGLGDEVMRRLPANFALDLNGIAAHARGIYPGNWELDQDSLVRRFAGELKEFLCALHYWRDHMAVEGERAKDKVCEELPDVLMWFASLWDAGQVEKNKAATSIRLTVDELIWDTFRIGCPRCSPTTGRFECTTCKQGIIDNQRYLRAYPNNTSAQRSVMMASVRCSRPK